MCVEGKIPLNSYPLLTAADVELARLSIMDGAAPRKGTGRIGLRELSGAGGITTYVVTVSWFTLWKGCFLKMYSRNYFSIACLVRD